MNVVSVPHCGSGNPDVDLACDVIYQAMADATSDAASSSSWSKSPSQDRAQAILFLTATHGDWAESRVMWCDQAGVNHDALRERALVHIQEAQNKAAERHRARLVVLEGMAA